MTATQKTFKRIPVPAPVIMTATGTKDILTGAPVAVSLPAIDNIPTKLPSLTKEALFGGKALFTVSNGRGTHLTFKLRMKEGEYRGHATKTYFLSVKTSDSAYGYSYVGIVNPADGLIKTTAKSKFLPETLTYKVANWAVQAVVRGKLIPERAEIAHAGKCGRCAKKLTDPLSIKRGIGPDCWEMMGLS